MNRIAFVVALWLGSASAVLACGVSAVCVDVENSLTGKLDGEGGITIDWETDDDDGTVARYELHRYDCQDTNHCLVSVATITARGTCSNNEEYTYADNPPDPDEDWTYRLQVFKLGISAPQCEFDVDPQ